MGYEWRDLTGLEKPEKLEPCWRCEHPPLEVAVGAVSAAERKAGIRFKGLPMDALMRLS